MIEGAALAAVLVVMVNGTPVKTDIDDYNLCIDTAEILKDEGKDAFCIPKTSDLSRVRNMMYTFMEMIQIMREEEALAKCERNPENLRHTNDPTRKIYDIHLPSIR